MKKAAILGLFLVVCVPCLAADGSGLIHFQLKVPLHGEARVFQVSGQQFLYRFHVEPHLKDLKNIQSSPVSTDIIVDEKAKIEAFAVHWFDRSEYYLVDMLDKKLKLIRIRGEASQSFTVNSRPGFAITGAQILINQMLASSEKNSQLLELLGILEKRELAQSNPEGLSQN